MGQRSLIDYGIQNEESDIRIHVSVKTRSIYVYRTKDGLAAINKRNYPVKPAYQGEILTAKGYLVPPEDIGGCLRIPIPPLTFYKAKFPKVKWSGSTSSKGRSAVSVVKQMLKDKLIPIKINITEVNDLDMQIKGIDITVKTEIKIQVKCDWSAGPKNLGGTGNLYLQIAESNPYKLY